MLFPNQLNYELLKVLFTLLIGLMIYGQQQRAADVLNNDFFSSRFSDEIASASSDLMYSTP